MTNSEIMEELETRLFNHFAADDDDLDEDDDEDFNDDEDFDDDEDEDEDE